LSPWHLQLEADLLGCRTLKWSHKIVYAYLRFRQGNNATSWAGLTTIATDLGVAKNTVIKAVRELEELGLIRAEKNARGGRAHSNKYVAVPFSVWQQKGSHPAPGGGRRKGSGSARKTVQLLNEKGSGPAPEKNRKNNNEKNNDRFEPASTVGNEGRSDESLSRKPPQTQATASGEHFERFWVMYPRKVGKKKCRAIWTNLKPTTALAEQIIDAVRAYKRTEQWQRDGGQFIPHPSTFLNQGRWEDEIPANPEPKRGDVDWLPTETEAEDILREAGVIV
jgi:hypothetical protein